MPCRPSRGDPLGLGHGGGHVPPRDGTHGRQPSARGLLHLRHGVVVDRHGHQTSRRVAGPDETLASQPDSIRVDDLGPDAEGVHHLQAFRDRIRPPMDVVQNPAKKLRTRHLAPVPTHHAHGPGPEQACPVEDPRGLTIDLHDPGQTLLPALGSP